MTRKRALAHGYATALSMVVGGILVGHTDWHMIFYLIGIALCGLGGWFLGTLTAHAHIHDGSLQ